MLPKGERLKYSGLFQQTYQKGKFLASKFLKINFTKTRQDYKESLPFVGFVVSKNYSKKASDRNKIKRQLREIYRLYRTKTENNDFLKDVGLLVIGLKSKLKADNTELPSYFELEKELTSLLNKVKNQI